MSIQPQRSGLQPLLIYASSWPAHIWPRAEPTWSGRLISMKHGY